MWDDVKSFRVYLLTLLFVIIAVPLLAQEKSKVIIDADMGQLNDDAVAMFMLTQTDSVEVLGVTTVSGNSWVEAETAYALKQLELIDRADIPVYQGAAIPLMGNRKSWLDAEERLWGNTEYLGAYGKERPDSYLELAEEPYGGYPKTEPEEQHAVDFIVESIKENPHEVTLFVLGPATNIALAIRKNPEIVPLVKEVIYMGGAFDVPGNTTPAAEFNWWFDPEAVYITLRAPFKKQTIVPLDISEEVYYTKEHYNRIANGPDTPIVQMFRDQHGPRFENNSDAKSYVWDAMTAAIFLKPEIATDLEERYVDMDVNYGPNYGRSMGYDERRRRDFSNPQNYPAGTEKAQILMDINREAFWDFYIELMTRPVK